MENKRILVIGGSGYIGKPIVKRLNKQGYKVTVLSRNPKKIINGIKYIQGNVMNKDFLLKNVKDFDVIIYLAAIIRTLKKSKYKENIIGLKNTIETMYTNKIKKIIYFSTQSIYIKKTGPYGNSKKACEKLILNSYLNYVVIRPNYVYGIDKYNDFYRLYSIIKKTKICPIIGSGKTRFQPINKNDIVEITLKYIKKWKPKEIVDVSGKTTISMNEVTEIIKKQTNSWFIKIHIPLSILQLFKWIVPFDVDGYTDDRTPINKNTLKGYANIKEDINNLIKIK